MANNSIGERDSYLHQRWSVCCFRALRMSSCSGASWSRFSKTRRAEVVCDVLLPSFYFARLVYQYPPFLRRPYRVESFRKIISCVLIRLRTVFHFCSHGFYGKEFSGGVIFFFFNFLFIVLRGPIVQTRTRCAPVSLASKGTRSSSCEITGKEA